MKPYASREQAGQVLAEALKAFHGKREEVVVAGVSDAGIIVASVIAKTLNLPLEVIVTKKIAVPGYDNLFLGAVSERGKGPLDEDLVALHGYSEENVQEWQLWAEGEVLQKASQYRQGGRPMNLKGKTVILVDDGVVTGFTMVAALETVRERGAVNVILAAPIGKASPLELLAETVQDVIVPHQMTVLGALSDYYEVFPVVTSESARGVFQESRMPSDRIHQPLESKQTKKVHAKN